MAFAGIARVPLMTDCAIDADRTFVELYTQVVGAGDVYEVSDYENRHAVYKNGEPIYACSDLFRAEWVAEKLSIEANAKRSTKFFGPKFKI